MAGRLIVLPTLSTAAGIGIAGRLVALTSVVASLDRCVINAADEVDLPVDQARDVRLSVTVIDDPIPVLQIVRARWT